MENFKGTPGPWKLSEVNGELITTENTNVCKVFSMELKEGQANAKLIAMAPELLDAIDRINKIVYANVIKVGSPDYHEIRNLCDHLIQKATE
jgi:hypothetical protein